MGKSVENNKIRLGRIFLTVFCILVLVFMGFILFTLLKIRDDGRKALREAKDVKLALQTADIEYYGASTSIYDPFAPDGFADGVKDKVQSTITYGGDYRLTGYSQKKHEITGLLFVDGDYIITYTSDLNGNIWEVDYMWNLLRYNDD